MEPSVEVRVERMAPEGQALGRGMKGEGEGKILFVPYGAPGDLLKVGIRKSKGTYAEGEIGEVLEPGPDRIQPPCPHHYQAPSPMGRSLRFCDSPTSGLGPQDENRKIAKTDPYLWCGGCDWQHLAYPAQLRAKKELILDCLRRIARLPSVPVADPIPSPAEFRYRNKAQVPVGRGTSSMGGGGLAAGFYHPGTHRIVEFRDCIVQPELSVRILEKVGELARRFSWKPYDEASGKGDLRHLFIRTNREGQALAAIVTRTASALGGREDFVREMTASFPELKSLYQNVQPERTSVILGEGWLKLWGQPFLEEKVGNLSLRASPSAFLQVNTPASEKLYAIVRGFLEPASASGGWRLADLYCGVGAIALWCADAFERVLGIEESPAAVQDAKANAALNGKPNVRFLRGRAEHLLEAALKASPAGSTAVVADPPRSGLHPRLLSILGRRPVPVFVYVSCDPATFARDAGRLCASGYRLEQVQPVDLFPQTSHIELAARFTRPA